MATPERNARSTKSESSSENDVSADGNNELASRRASRLKFWHIILIVAIVILAVALAFLAYIAYSYWNGQKTYDDIAQEAFSAPVSTRASADDEFASSDGSDVVDNDLNLSDFTVDWDALRAINPDVVGWIYVPDTQIDYPIAHIDGDDDYYLTHNFSGSSSGQFGAQYGCIMLSGENSADFSDMLNVIYGHNMSNGSMFGLLAQFYNSDIFNAHRTFYLLTPQCNYRLSSFAVVHVPGDDTSIIIPNFDTREEFEAYIYARRNSSVVDTTLTESEVEQMQQIFAFSTCDGADNSYRYITFCRVEDYALVS